MSYENIHQPLLSRYMVVDVPEQPGKTEARHVGRCFCGWESSYFKTAWEASRSVRDHVEAKRRRR